MAAVRTARACLHGTQKSRERCAVHFPGVQVLQGRHRSKTKSASLAPFELGSAAGTPPPGPDLLNPLPLARACARSEHKWSAERPAREQEGAFGRSKLACLLSCSRGRRERSERCVSATELAEAAARRDRGVQVTTGTRLHNHNVHVTSNLALTNKKQKSSSTSSPSRSRPSP